MRRTGSSWGSSWRSWRRDSSLEGMSMANFAAFTRLASFSREDAAMDLDFPTMAVGEGGEASLGEFAWNRKRKNISVVIVVF